MENPFQVKTNSIKLKQVEEFYRTVRWLIPSCWNCFYIPCPWLSTVLQYLIPFKWVTSKPSEECSPWLLEITPITHFPCKSGLDVWLMFLRYRVWFFRTWKWWKFNLLKNSRKEWWRTSLLFELFSLHFYYKWKFYTIWKWKVNKPIKHHFGRIWNWYYWLISYFTGWPCGGICSWNDHSIT